MMKVRYHSILILFVLILAALALLYPFALAFAKSLGTGGAVVLLIGMAVFVLFMGFAIFHMWAQGAFESKEGQ